MTVRFPNKFTPRPDTWLWDMLGDWYDIPMDWFQRRYHFLKVALEEAKFRRDAAITPELGPRSKLAAVEISGGRDVKYVIVYAREVPESFQPGIRETLTYRRDVAGTDLIYDVTGEFMQGKARPFECDLRTLPLRVYAVLPFQVERLELAAQQRANMRVIRGDTQQTNRIALNLRLGIQDATGMPIAGRLPICLGLRRREPHRDRGSYTVADESGRPSRLVSQVESSSGDWLLVVRLLLTGDELSLPLELVSKVAESAASDVPLTSDGLTVHRVPRPVKLDER